MLYDLARPLLFRMDAERVHEMAIRRLEAAGRSERLTRILRARYFREDPRLAQELWGTRFPNPVGIAAGFDKNAKLVNVLPHLGFGFIEIGTVTSEAQSGNPKPRLFRLPKDKALINRLGFNNDGADLVAARLAKAGPTMVPLGVNIGKARKVPNSEATADYVRTFEKLYPYGNYFVVNVSSPNTPGLRDLQGKEALSDLLAALREKNHALSRTLGGAPRPILVKLSPDLTREALHAAVDVARAERVDGLIATNTTTTRVGLKTKTTEEGGLSGAPLRERSTLFVRELYAASGGKIPIIGVGGVFTAEDAWEKIRAGASLVQLYTGFIYGGPATPRRINESLLELMDENGIDHLADAVGTDVDLTSLTHAAST